MSCGIATSQIVFKMPLVANEAQEHVDECSCPLRFQEIGKAFFEWMKTKRRFFSLLAENIQAIPTEGKQAVTSFGESALFSPVQTDMQALIPWTHEEADTRMFIHVADATHSGYKRIILRLSDSDVIV